MSTRARERPSEAGEDAPQPAADVRLEGVRKSFGDIVAVDGVDLEIDQGEFFSLLGPSGSGKTTLLRIIAGFERPDSGRVHLRGIDVTSRPPYARQVNTVFQDYALFPHMSVQENVEYGLRVRGAGRKERAERAANGARDGAATRVREPQAEPALRRPAATRRPRAGDRQPARSPPPRRTPRSARPQAPRGDAGRAQAHPAGGRDHVRLRDPRPGGGADDERSPRRLQPRKHRADRHSRRGLRAPGDRLCRGLRRRVQHPRARRPPLHGAAREDPNARRRRNVRSRRERRERPHRRSDLCGDGHSLHRRARCRGRARRRPAEPRDDLRRGASRTG